jgi:tetratricopeptide (TPR) repeat protein
VLAHAYAEAGDIRAARQQLDAAMRLHTDRTEEGLREFCLVSKAIVDTMTAEFDGAAEASEQVLESSFGSLGWTGPAARSILGSIMFERGDTDRARSWLTDAIALAESLGDHGDALLGHLDLVVIECAAGRLDAAEAQFAAALELSPEAISSCSWPEPSWRCTAVSRRGLASWPRSPSPAPARWIGRTIAAAASAGSATHNSRPAMPIGR